MGDDKTDSRTLYKIVDIMMELNLQTTKSYETLAAKILQKPLTKDSYLDLSDRQSFIRNALARNKQADPEIKPMVSAPRRSPLCSLTQSFKITCPRT